MQLLIPIFSSFNEMSFGSLKNCHRLFSVFVGFLDPHVCKDFWTILKDYGKNSDILIESVRIVQDSLCVCQHRCYDTDFELFEMMYFLKKVF